MASKIKISETPDKPKATFLRKSAFLSTGDESFRFNFNLAPDQAHNVNPTGSNNSTAGNTSDTKPEVPVADSEKPSENSDKKFKFAFTNSDFKFNFNVDN